MSHPVIHWEIGAKDPVKLAEFYKKLFNWEINHVPQIDYHLCEVGEGGIGGGIAKIDETKGEKPYITVYIKVDDLQATLDKAVKMGAKVLVPPTLISEQIGSFAMFTDPDGLLVGILKTGTM
jgi:predicted enzyme related to lactoylglutathione lyase